MCASTADIQLRRLRLGEDKKKVDRRNHWAKDNGWPALFHRATINRLDAQKKKPSPKVRRVSPDVGRESMAEWY